jgi:hypothetical protein
MAADGTSLPSHGHNQPPARPFSVWSILALLLSVTAFCPLFSVLGALFALRAIAEIKTHPELRGRGMAKVAMAISILATLSWILGGVYWSTYARTPMLAGPVAELRAGLSGDIATFRNGFTGNGGEASEEEARGFLQEVSRRYGAFSGGERDLTAKGSMPAGGQGRIPYVLHFSSGDVRAEALFVSFGGSLFRPVFAWDWLSINDPEKGDLVYPLAARERAKPQVPAPQP